MKTLAYDCGNPVIICLRASARSAFLFTGSPRSFHSLAMTKETKHPSAHHSCHSRVFSRHTGEGRYPLCSLGYSKLWGVCVFPLLRIIIISVVPGLLSPHKHICVCGGPMCGAPLQWRGTCSATGTHQCTPPKSGKNHTSSSHRSYECPPPPGPARRVAWVESGPRANIVCVGRTWAGGSRPARRGVGLSPEALAKGDLSPVASAKGEIRVMSNQ